MIKEEELDWLYRLKCEIYVYMPVDWITPMNDALDSAIKSLEQEPKTGHWIFDEVLDRHYYCSECKSMGVDYWDYCPNCGAKMQESQESDIENLKEWSHKPCINYEDGCEEWAGCPCVYYKAESEE